MADNTLILAFDTATPHCSCALTRGGMNGGKVIGSIALDSGITHSRRLLGSLEQLLNQASVTMAEISAIGVGLGPGSFTGLRIGMATAKGLAHGARKKLVGILSLDALAAEIKQEGLICTLLDARKKEVYGRFYQNRGGTIRPCSNPFVTPPEKLAAHIDQPVIMGGDGVEAYRELLKESLGSRMEMSTVRYPSAEIIGLLAEEKFSKGEFCDLATAAPAYVRASDAELSLIRDKGGIVTS